MPLPVEGFVSARASYPPTAERHPVPIGYVQDHNRVGYSRDIGRSSLFAGYWYYVFGDTFCKNRQGDFVGMTSNTVAIIPNTAEPLETQYLDIKPDGIVQPLIPLNEAETLLELGGVRVVLWAFGGIVETVPEVGWIWYQKTVIYPNDYQHYHGVGIARISPGATPLEPPTAFRLESMIFGPDEPRIGTFSSLVHEDFVYLWGDYQGKIILARVEKHRPTSRNAYRYWNGEAYVTDWRDAIPVLRDIQQGCFFRSSLFGSERPFVFVGCTKFADSIVMMGAEACLEGPWCLSPLFQADGINQPNNYRYCMYGHPWAFDEENGELLVTYSESWPGGVVGAKVKLMMGDAYYWQRVPINNYSNQDQVNRLVAPWCEDAHNLDPSCDAHIRLEGRFVAPGFAASPGTLPLCLRVEYSSEETVRRTVEVISILLSLDERLREDGGEWESLGSGERRRSGRLSRAISRVFRRGSPESGSSGADPLSSWGQFNGRRI